jgi:hypothetical protein
MKKIEILLALKSGLYLESIHKKPEAKKSLATVPLEEFSFRYDHTGISIDESTKLLCRIYRSLLKYLHTK